MEQPSRRVNPYNTVRRNPYEAAVRPLEQDEDDKPGFFDHLGDLASFAKNVFTDPQVAQSLFSKVRPFGLGASAEQNKENAVRNIQTSEHLAQNFTDAIANPFMQENWFKSQVSGLGAGLAGTANAFMHPIDQLAPGLMDMFIKTPIEAVSGRKMGPDGAAIPATPEEQAKAMQATAAAAAQIILAKKIHTSMTAVPEGAAALAENAVRPMGKVYKLAKADVVAGAASGGLYGAIAGAGDEDHMAQILTNAIGFAPLGIATAILGLPAYNKRLKTAVRNFEETGLPIATELGAINELRASVDKNGADLLSAIDGISNADTRTEAAIRANLTNGKGFIAEGVSDEAAARIDKNLRDAKPQVPVFEPSEQALKKLKKWERTNIGGKMVHHLRWFDSFDQAAYFLRNGKHPELMGEIIAQNPNLDPIDVMAHGKFVSKRLTELGKTQKYGKLTAEEVESVRNAVREEGEDIISKLGEGAVFKDNTGRDWKRVGGTISNGELTYPVTTDIAKETLGLKPYDIPKLSDGLTNILEVPKQSYTPRYGRQTFQFEMYNGPNGTRLFYPGKLPEGSQRFFEKSGFVPGEKVIVSGNEFLVRNHNGTGVQLEQASTGAKYWEDAKNVRRMSNPLTAEWGPLTQENYAHTLFNEFMKRYDLDAPSPEAFDDTFRRFANDYGVKQLQDQSNLKAVFIQKLRDKIKSTLEPEEKAALEGIENELFDSDKKWRESEVYQAWDAAKTNNLHFDRASDGGYRILDDQGNEIHRVDTIGEVKQIVNSRQSPSIDLATAGASVPGELGNIGAKHVPNLDWWDHFTVHGLNGIYGTWMAPPADLFRALDEAHGTKTLTEAYVPLQRALNDIKRLADRADIKEMQTLHNQMVEAAKGLSDERKSILFKFIQTKSADEIKSGLLSRPLNTPEVAFAERLSQQDVGKVLQYLYDVREKSGFADIGSTEFEIARANERMKYQDVAGIGDEIFDAVKMNVKDFSIYGAIRLAEAIRNPATHISRAEFLGKHKITPQEFRVAGLLDKFYDRGVGAFGLDPDAKINGYLPHAKIISSTTWTPRFPGVGETTASFAHELTRMGILGDAHLITDPVKLTNLYFHAGLRHISGLNEALKNAEKYAASGIPTKVGGYLTEYVNKVRLKPDLEAQLAKAIVGTQERLKLIPAQGSVMATVNAAFMAARPILAARDLTSAVGMSYTLYGAEFTRKAFFNVLKDDYVKGLINEGKIPKTEGIDLAVPGNDPRFVSKYGKTMSNVAMTTSLQHWAYTKSIAGVYKATSELVSDAVDQYMKDRDVLGPEKAKAKAMEALKMDMHGDVVQKYVADKWDSIGNWHEDVTRWLGMWNGKMVAGIYQSFNNPIKWNGAYGRVMGHLGTWGTNAIQVTGNSFSKGTKMQIAKRALRWSTYFGALSAAGATAGVDLGQWIFSPLAGFRIGPIPQFVGDLAQGLDLQKSNDERTRQYGQMLMSKYSPVRGDGSFQKSPFLPGSFAVQDWLEGYDLWDRGEGPMALARAAGFKLNNQP